MDTWDRQCDLLIIGSGAGSVPAALVAKDNNLEALIVEKQHLFGGSTGLSGGVVWVPNNPLMAREGVSDSYERSRQYLDAAVTYQGPGTTNARREAFLKTGPEMISYLEKKGMRFKRTEGYADYHVNLPGGEPRSRSLIAPLFDLNELGDWKDKLALFKGAAMRVGMDELSQLLLVKRTWSSRFKALKIGLRLGWQKMTGKDVRGAGASLQGRLLQIALREKIPILLETVVTEFIVENGRITGVIATQQDKPLRIQARKGVLINAGGFSRNAEMRKRYAPQPTDVGWSNANPGDTGEILKAGMDIGAATDCLDQFWWVVTSRGPNDSFPEGAITDDGTPVPFGHHFDLSFPHVIVVDQEGNRIGNEAGSYMRFGQCLYERQHKNGKAMPVWAIIEKRHRDRYLWGTWLGKTPQSWFDSGYMKKADSLQELASQCGINADGLVDTVKRVNRYAETGIDEDYEKGGSAFDNCHGDPTVKPNPNLGAIEQPPFYAVAIYPGDIGNAGGLVTDEHGRVLDKAGNPIVGLFATGNTTASVMGKTYPGAGATIAPAMVFGYRAAKYICHNNLNQDLH